jgi:serine/threonine protein kinase
MIARFSGSSNAADSRWYDAPVDSDPFSSSEPKTVGRYALFDEIASGGMASVHYGRLLGPVGFSRTVAIKRLHPQFAKDPDFASMFIDEARLAARVQHPNVVQTIDVVALPDELFLVMEYVPGESLGRLIRASRAAKKPIPLPIVSAIFCGTLQGLHAAHGATTAEGEPLHLVHRDVSPQNILVGADGVPRVLDFGVAKAVGRLHTTGEGQLKGKLPYMSPEQVADASVDHRTDVYAAAAVLWEALTQRRLFNQDNEAAVIAAVMGHEIEPPSSLAPDVPKELDALCLRGLEADPAKRFASAWDFALALEACVPPATTARVSEWVKALAGEILTQRAEAVQRIESSGSGSGASGPVRRSSRPPAAPPPADGDGQPSQVSSISVSSSAQRQAGGRSRLGYLAGAAGAVLFLFAVVLFWRGARRDDADAHPAAASSASVASPPPPAPERETPSAAPVASALTSAVVAPPAASSSPRPVSRRREHERTAAPKSSASARSAHCDPPYVIDAAGHRQYKPECL